MRTYKINVLVLILILAGFAHPFGRKLYLFEYEPKRYAIEFKDWQFTYDRHIPLPFPTGVSHYKYWLVVPDTVGKFPRTAVMWSHVVPDSVNTKLPNVPTEGWVELKSGKVEIRFVHDCSDNGVHKLIVVKGIRKLSEK